VRDLSLQVPVELPQAPEEVEIEDAVGADGDHDGVVLPEQLAEAVVADARRIAGTQEALERVVRFEARPR
jgi:hypothetical protein